MKYEKYEKILVSNSNLLKEKYYWNSVFSEEFQKTCFPEMNRSEIKKKEYNQHCFKIENEPYDNLMKLSKNNKISVYITLLTCLNILIYKYTGNKNVSILSPIYRKNDNNCDNDRVLIKNSFNSEMTFKEMLIAFRKNVLDAYENQDILYEYLMNDVLKDEEKDLTNIVCSLLDIHSKQIEIVKGGIYFNFKCNYEFIDCQIIYHGINIDTDEIVNLSEHFKNILATSLKDINTKVKDINILSEEELCRIKYEFNSFYADFPIDKTVYSLFEKKAKETPEEIAIISANYKLTYKELNQYANQLARILRKNNIKNDSLVGIMMERSHTMVASILAVWKAGGAYVPISTHEPEKRLVEILEDSKLQILLTERDTIDSYSFANNENLYLENNLVKILILDEMKDNIGREDVNNLDNINKPNDLAYVIYTSGSTGRPKGAMVEHAGMMNHIQAKIKDLKINENSIIAQNASQCFDISVWQFFAAMCVGGRIVIYKNEDIMEPEKFIKKIIEDKINILEVVPSYLSTMLDFLDERFVDFKEINMLVVTGEELKSNLIKRWFEKYEDTNIVNAYGPTEAADDITHFIIKKYDNMEQVPIGKPIWNQKIYIVDDDMNLCPIGVKGEICVSGIGVGRGYLGDIEKTNKVFIDNIFDKDSKFRIYKTGDIGLWRKDGNIEFYGRKDYQVKIRGYRIELGEIEKKILKYEGIKEIVVIDMVNKDDTKYLCAFFTSYNEIEILSLREWLKSSLVEYMIPSEFIKLDALPVNNNGKVDRKLLIKMKNDQNDTLVQVIPKNEIEDKLLKIYKEILKRDDIGINDNFFTMGGDSIRIIQVASRLSKLGYKLEIKDIYENPKISDLSAFVKPILLEKNQEMIKGIVPLTPIQINFFSNEGIKHSHFNQALMIESTNRLDKNILEKIFLKIVEHHDALRMVFRKENNHNIQENMGVGNSFSIEKWDLREEESVDRILEEKINDIQMSFNLETGPLMKLGLFNLSEKDLLVIVIHHLVIDGVSWRIMFEDIDTLFTQYLNNEEFVLPNKSDSYKLWSERVREYCNSDKLLREKNYWKEILDVNESYVIDSDYDEKELIVRDIKTLSFNFSNEETQLLLTKTNAIFSTNANDILLTGLAYSFNKIFGVNNILVALEGHGREQILENIDVSRTIGWFTSIYPVKIELNHKENLARQIKDIKEILHKVPNKGVGYGILKYITDKKHTEDINFNVKPQVLFNYLGEIDSEMNKSNLKINSNLPGYSTSQENKCEYDFSVSGIVINSSLEISISYNSKQYSLSKVKSLISAYESELRRIIILSSQTDDIDFTPSDLDFKDLTIDELEELFD